MTDENSVLILNDLGHVTPPLCPVLWPPGIPLHRVNGSVLRYLLPSTDALDALDAPLSLPFGLALGFGLKRLNPASCRVASSI